MHAWNEPASAARLYMLFVHCGVPEAHLAAITNGLERLRVLTRPHPHGLRTLRLLLIGDHVLPHITPTIGRWPSTQPDPLGRYIASLRALIDLDVRLVLPGHGYPFTRWASRLQELLAHHDIRLAHMEAAVHSGATVYDVCRHVFDLEALSLDEARFALTETLAHLDHLVQAGRLQRRGDGVWCYSRM